MVKYPGTGYDSHSSDLPRGRPQASSYVGAPPSNRGPAGQPVQSPVKMNSIRRLMTAATPIRYERHANAGWVWFGEEQVQLH